MCSFHVNKILILLFILIPVHLISQIQISFQDGVNGYNSTVDTYIDNTNPNSFLGSSPALLWDGEPSEYTTFIRFGNLFISQGGPIPDNSYIISATLTYYVFNNGDDAAVSEVLSSWNDSLTWNQFNFTNDIGPYIGNAESGIANSYENLDITNSLSTWSANPSLNNGWIFQFTGSDGCDIYSSERTIINQRPELTVVYSNNFPPNQPALVSPTDESTDIDLSPTLILNVSDPDYDNLSVRYFARAVSSAAGNFTLIGIPDTQYYTTYVYNNQYFYDQMNWIVANKDVLNIVFVSQFGDCVQNGNTDDSEWQVVNTAWSIVENSETTGLADGIPYGLNVGNHDQTPIGGGSSASTAKYNEYFGFSRIQGRAYYGGHYGSDNDNHYELYSAGGMDFILINLEYDTTPEQDVLDWADALLNTYGNRRAIVVSHYLIETDNSISPNAFGSQGQQIYDNLKDNSNLFLMLCGHNHGEGRRSDIFNGNTINTLLSDYQSYPNGGNGYLRIMEFRPGENKIYISTYSPSLDQFESDSNSEFVINYDMGSESFQEIGYVNGITSGSDAGFNWSSLSPETAYEWYVEISDGNNTTISPTWSFITESEDNTLPVTLSQFSATPFKEYILLNWLTESELFNLGFNVYRSDSENNSFLRISTYQNNSDLKGLGNSSTGKEYICVDSTVEENKNYWYQISDVDFTGKEIFHQVIPVITESFIPNNFTVGQNYPNPFNPETHIGYAIPKDSKVTIILYNVRGQTVATLFNEFQTAGNHIYDLYAGDLPSGIFFYKIQAAEHSLVKKMIHLK